MGLTSRSNPTFLLLRRGSAALTVALVALSGGLRAQAAIDPNVTTIKITCYRLAANSKIINALINAVRNGKHVTVMLELKARFDEEANLEWKERLEDEGRWVDAVTRALVGLAPAGLVPVKGR